MQKLRDLLLTKESAEKAISILTSVEATQTDKTQYIDFLEILFGRITQIQEAGEVGRTVEDEVQQIVQFAVTDISSAKHDGVREALLDIISYMPCRTENEIKSVLKLIQGTTDARIQEACANALAHASPQTPEARAIIESEKQSNIEAIRKAVNTFIHFSSFPNSDNFEQA